MNGRLGQQLRQLRKNKKLTLAKVTELTGIDTGLLSKIERGDRIISKESLLILSAIYETRFDELEMLRLGEKVLAQIEYDQEAQKVLEVAEQMMAYPAKKNMDKESLLMLVRKPFIAFPAVKKAWLFGSFAKDQTHALSDVDIAIETDATFSYFDLADLQHELENVLARKVDIGFVDAMKQHVLDSSINEWIQIYEKK
jgi:predicted nucleotidyltransferase